MRHLSAIALLLASVVVSAEINIASSLDWLVIEAPHIRLVRVEGEKVLTEVLKGAPPEVPGIAGVPDEGELSLLYFFDADGKSLATVNLSTPGQGHGEPAFTPDFQVLSTGREILDRVRARLERMKKEEVKEFHWFECPMDSAAFKALWSGSACYLKVPADPEYRARFLEELTSEDVHVRARAAWRLSRHPGEDTVAALQPLLADPGTAVIHVFRDGKSEDVTVWPVRQRAYDALTKLGVDAAKPEGWREQDADHHLDW